MRILTTLGVCAALLLTGSAYAETPEERRLLNATEVLAELAAIPEEGIPPTLLRSAYGIAVIPDLVKVGLLVGARYGKGLLVVRQADGTWSPPSFITIGGGSLGWQAGAQSSDIILVIKNRRGVEGITSGKLTLGADASVAAGPVGRYTSASTDIRLRSEVYSYSRSRGLFLGIALDGAALGIDQKANAAFYARPGVTADAIFAADDLSVPAEAERFLQTLGRLAPQQDLPVPPPGSDESISETDAAGGAEPAVRTYGIGEGDGSAADEAAQESDADDTGEDREQGPDG